MFTKLRFAGIAASACLACMSISAFADDHPYSEGNVVNVARIRTIDGHFDDYMRWIATTWKQMQETAKKNGFLVSYQVMTVEARGPDDADVLLVTTYKNWAALDGWIMKGDTLSKQVEGSVAAANQSEIERAKIRRVLGSSTMQVIDLK